MRTGDKCLVKTLSDYSDDNKHIHKFPVLYLGLILVVFLKWQ